MKRYSIPILISILLLLFGTIPYLPDRKLALWFSIFFLVAFTGFFLAVWKKIGLLRFPLIFSFTLFVFSVALSLLTLNFLFNAALAIGGFGLLLASFLWSEYEGHSSAASDPFLRAVSITTVVMSFYHFVIIPAIDVTKIVRIPMKWSYGEPVVGYPQCEGRPCKRIELQYTPDPNRFETIISTDLGNYLEHLPNSSVDVVFEVRFIFGRWFSHSIKKIGALDRWDVTSGSSGCRGECSAHFLDNLDRP